MRLIGPNCAGVISRPGGLAATFARHPSAPASSSGLAVISQSGAVGMMLFGRLDAAGCPADIAVTTGNEADLTVADVLEAVAQRTNVREVVMFVGGHRGVGGTRAGGRRGSLTRCGGGDAQSRGHVRRC